MRIEEWVKRFIGKKYNISVGLSEPYYGTIVGYNTQLFYRGGDFRVAFYFIVAAHDNEGFPLLTDSDKVLYKVDENYTYRYISPYNVQVQYPSMF